MNPDEYWNHEKFLASCESTDSDTGLMRNSH